MINYKIVFNILSKNLFIIAFSLVFCIGIALVYNEDILPFAFATLISFGVGGVFHLLSKMQNDRLEVQKKEAYLSVSLSWIFITVIGSLPYIFSGSIPVFVNAIFESVSGFTTTGSSILTDIEALPYSILFWRSLTHWIGGLGIIVLFIIVMPTLNIAGYQLFTLESSFQDKIHPKIKSVGLRLLYIYIALTVAEMVFLLLGGMNLFDSVCHSFGTIATGGFSPKNDSVAGYSPYIQYVIMVFMLLAGTNFIIHYYLVKRKFRKVRENDEVKFYLIVIAVVGFIITGILFFGTSRDLETSFRESFFQVISIVTCTGFASADYLIWPKVAWMIIFFSMFFGGSTGSTAGGIKMARHLVLFRNIQIHIRQMLKPHAIFPVMINRNPVNERTNLSILTFIGFYLIVFIIGSLLLIFSGLDAASASSSAATAMAGIGPGIGTVGPVSNFAHLALSAKLIMTFLMITGRLEIYTLLIMFTPAFWKD